MIEIAYDEACLILGALKVCNSEGIVGMRDEDYVRTIYTQKIIEKELKEKLLKLYPDLREYYESDY